MKCHKHADVCWECIREDAHELGDAFKRKYRISARTERQLVAMSDHVPPHPGEDSKDWLERLYRAWYAANQ